LAIDPELAVARWNRSFVLFLQGDWLSGWKDFEWRFKIPKWRTLYPHRIPGKKWDGRPVPDQVLIVHDEQGLGDTLQFVRYLPLARQCCGRLILETRPELIPLLNGMAGVDQFLARSSDGPPAVPFDRYIPLMSLPGLFETSPDTVPFTSPYIKAPEEKIEYWSNHLPNDRFKIGLVWAGRPEHANDANRSCCLEQLSILFDLSRFHFVSLQKGPAAKQIAFYQNRNNFSHIGEQLNDFADTAGVIMNLDLMITVDTSVAHLAGAMGKPVWLMLPVIPDWRWGMRGSTTPWYPTMTLFRQIHPKNWSAVIEHIRSGLMKSNSESLLMHKTGD
jgi:hypothetical protein